MPISSVEQVGAAFTPPSPVTVGGTSSRGISFARLVQDARARGNVLEMQANQAVQELATGQPDNVHGVMLAVAKADLHFRLWLEIRNRLLEAYQEITRMQI